MTTQKNIISGKCLNANDKENKYFEDVYNHSADTEVTENLFSTYFRCEEKLRRHSTSYRIIFILLFLLK